MTKSNSASRVLDVIEKLKKTNPNKRVVSLWAAVLEVDEADYASILQGMASVLAELNNVEKCVRAQVDLDHELYLTSFGAIRSLLGPASLSMNAPDVIAELSKPHNVVSLRFCADLLNRVVPEVNLDSETLKRLANEVATVLSEVSKDTSLPPALRELLARLLHSIHSAIMHYWIHGAAGVRTSLEEAIGSLIAHREVLAGFEESRSFDKVIKIVKKGAEAVEATGAFVKSGFALASAIGSGIKLLS